MLALRTLLIAVSIIFLTGVYGSTTEDRIYYYYLDTANAPMPSKYNRIYICHGHGCNAIDKFTFNRNDLKHLKSLMTKSDSAVQERKNLSKAVAWFENRVCSTSKTCTDHAGGTYMSSGDPTQLDCVDEATNTTSLMLVMQKYKMFKFHKVVEPSVKMSIQPHWFSSIEELSTKQVWGVDSFFSENGQEPWIDKVEVMK